MAEYIKREDALNEIHRFRGYIDEDMEYRMKSAINKIPSADVAEVVRCKDCFYGRIYGNSNSYYCVLTTACHGDDFFCANGARMDGGT